jgi:hypothetical protein
LVTVPCSALSLSTYTHLFPTASGKKAAAPLPVDTEPADPELAGPELAGAALAVLPVDWPDEEDAVEPEVLPQPVRIRPEAAAAARMPVACVRVMTTGLLMSCLGLGYSFAG